MYTLSLSPTTGELTRFFLDETVASQNDQPIHLSPRYLVDDLPHRELDQRFFTLSTLVSFFASAFHFPPFLSDGTQILLQTIRIC